MLFAVARNLPAALGCLGCGGLIFLILVIYLIATQGPLLFLIACLVGLGVWLKGRYSHRRRARWRARKVRRRVR